MSETNPDRHHGHQPRGARIVDWLNNLDPSLIPPNLRKNDGGAFTLDEFQKMPENMRERIIGAFDRREGGQDPFPHYEGGAGDPQNPATADTGGPNTHPGGGSPHHGGKGPQKTGSALRQNLAAEYGWSMAFLNPHPELKQLFNQAVKNTWTPERFVAELRDTNWFKHNSASVRQFMVNRATDPASWQNDLNKTIAHVSNVWGATFGVPLDGDLAQKWAIRAMKFGWSEEQINDHLVQSMNFRKLLRNDSMGGTAAQTANQIRTLASDYGVGATNKWIATQMERVLKGNDTMDGVLNSLKERAKSKYEAFGDQLDAGKTMSDIADPYVQEMSQLLEMNPSQLGATSHMIQKALTRRVDGKSQPMSIADFGDAVRKDPRWMHTQQANDQFSQTAYGLLQNWGLI